MADRQLGIYLNDHLGGSTAGLALAKRAARSNAETPLGETLTELVPEIDADREALIGLMRELGVPRRRYKAVGAAIGEKFGRLKLNGAIVRRSQLSPLIELEGLSLGIEGKASLWRSLAVAGIKADAHDLEDLERRAESQRKRLEAHRGEAANTAFG